MKIGDKELTLQRPGTMWFLDLVDNSKDRNGNVRSAKMVQGLLENVVIEPANMQVDDLTINEVEQLQIKVGEWLRTD